MIQHKRNIYMIVQLRIFNDVSVYDGCQWTFQEKGIKVRKKKPG